MGFRKLERIPPVKSVMTPFPWFIHAEDRLSRALEVMEQNQIRHLPVTEGSELVGLVTHRDIGLVLGPNPSARRREELTVGDVCIRQAYVVELHEPLDRVVLEMAERHIGSALVTRSGKLAGIFTVTDACRCLGALLRGRFPDDPGDDEAA